MSVKNAPYVNFNFPISNTHSEKFTPPKHPNIGDIILLVNDVTTLWNAPPINTPTAKSKTFPLNANSLNSFKNFPCFFFAFSITSFASFIFSSFSFFIFKFHF